MSVKFKVISLFFSLYAFSVMLLVLISLVLIRDTLYDYFLNYVEYQANPIIEFYQNYYRNPNSYAKLLSEDVVSREISSLLISKEGRLVNLESFLDGESPNIQPQMVRQMINTRRGIIQDYAFIVKKVGDYHLILLGKLDRIREVERRILIFTLALLLTVSVPASLLAYFMINRLLSPLSYLRMISERISKGELNIELSRSKRRDEFGQLEESYASMLERLKGIILWQREFIRNITHALKTPLTFIKGQVELIQMGIYNQERLKTIYQNIQFQAEKMEKLITHLVTIMRLESQAPFRPEKFSVNQLFAEIEEEYEFIKEERRFRVEYLEEDREIEADKEYLKMAIRNLLENSYKYTEKDGNIRLYWIDGCLVVEDDGIGMENPERAGELFYREANDKEGSGLGLHIVKLIAQKSGLTMKLESQKGLGTKVSLCYNLKL